MKTAGVILLAGAIGLVSSCSSDPVDAAGNYTIAVTNRENGCAFANWMEGNSATNIGLTITQAGSDITGTVNGVTGSYLTLVLGDNVFHGGVDGDELEMTIYGTRSGSQGNCTYTVNATANATLDGDVLDGNIYYRAATNGNPDCSALEGCASRQQFNGTRPPQ